MGLITLQNKVSTFAATKRNNMSTILFADHTAKRTLTYTLEIRCYSHVRS